MGSNTTKLRKYVEKGDETHALEFYNKAVDLRNKLNANNVINQDTLDTWMHIAAKNGMKSFLKILLNQHDGNPKKLNKKRQNVLHKICEGTNDSSQLECIHLVLAWIDKSNNEKLDINDKDDMENTALHYAAMKNLHECVTDLLSNGAYLFIENKNKLTPCDLAERNGQKDMALLLESKMIFSNNEDKDECEQEILLVEEVNYGLRVQDLQEKKDKLLVETSDMFQCTLFEAELLLKKHLWSKEDLLQNWFDDPVKCFEKCGIIPPSTAATTTSVSSNVDNIIVNSPSPSKDCSICLVDFTSDENCDLNPQCGHKFCKSCWKSYLTIKIEDGCTGEILCPYLGCYMIIPHEIIEKLISKETARKYLQFDIKAFVETNPSIKWCPFPGCNMAIHDPYIDDYRKVRASSHSSRNEVKKREYSKSIDCGAGHYSCWDCLQEGHEPATCQNWKDWFEKIQNIKPEELYNTNVKEELSANYLWLVSNSKKCPNPNCTAPIQKNEGCNHMKCSKCKHDFCWVCMEPWKKHSSATGGYFQCNRYEVSNKVTQIEKDTISEAEESHVKVAEINRFVHYYSRFKNHEHSFKIEEPLLSAAKHKYELLTAQLIKANQNENLKLSQPNLLNAAESIKLMVDDSAHAAKATTSSTSTLSINNASESDNLFIEDAIKELLKSRRILRASYVYGYYLDNSLSYKKITFEFIQTEFEECTENLSQIIARPYLKTPKAKIIKTTKLLKRKRIEFLETISEDLILPETPPSFKRYSKKRWKYLLKDDSQDDEELRNAIALSIKELNPKDPWIVDKKGRHTNLIALLNDMPELEHDLERRFVPSKNQGTCTKFDCHNPKAINTLTGIVLNYCSINCMRSDRESSLQRRHQQLNQIPIAQNNTQKNRNTSNGDLSSLLFDDKTFYSDLERAISLSKKQDLRDRKLKHFGGGSFADTDTDFDDENSSIHHNNNFDNNSQHDLIQDELQLAIQLSLQTYNNELDHHNRYTMDNNHDEEELGHIDSEISSTSGAAAKTSCSNNKQYKLLPYNPIYLANKNDLSTLFKNMNDIVDDDDDDEDELEEENDSGSDDNNDNVAATVNTGNSNKKMFNFELKSKKLKYKKNKQSAASNNTNSNQNNDKDTNNESLRI